MRSPLSLPGANRTESAWLPSLTYIKHSKNMYHHNLPDLAEITRRCKKRGVIKFTRRDEVYEFRIIKACEAKGYDGTNDQPWPASDPRTALERKVIRSDGSKYYANHWGWGQE